MDPGTARKDWNRIKSLARGKDSYRLACGISDEENKDFETFTTPVVNIIKLLFLSHSRVGFP
jgi:hypothetical protein